MTDIGERAVFVGPSLSAKDIRRRSGFRFFPPVADGDVFRAVARGASVIGIVDGYFETKPAIRHKEILWAIARGVRVYGASSMGALRAAELHRYGMIGVGAIYEAFACGRLENDDAVAVAHGPAELGYPAVSETLVDIQATVDAAGRDGSLCRDEADAVVAAARSLYFKDRNWLAIGNDLAHRGFVKARRDQIVGVLSCNAVSAKRDDARMLLDRMLEDRAAPVEPPTFELPETPAFRRARDRAFDIRGSD